MNRHIIMTVLMLPLLIFSGCKGKEKTESTTRAMTAAELTAMAEAVPKSGAKTGNNYKVFFLALRQNQQPAVGFKVDAWVKGKSKPVTVRTDARGLAVFETLPFPDAKQKLNIALHYYKGPEDLPREIEYPFIESDAYRLKDIQYIPNTVTPDPSQP